MGAKLAKELRSPSQGSIMGWCAQKIMSMGKGSDSIDAVSQILTPTSISAAVEKPIIVEIGPGAGYALRELIHKYNPSKVYGIEISEAFRNKLNEDEEFGTCIKNGILSLHDNDAKDLSFVPDNSVDIIFAFNVVYFLDPLQLYLMECNRILKPGGSINFGVKKIAKDMDPSVYINTDWDICLEEMKNSGFVDVEAKEERLEGPLAYVPLVGKKR